MDKASLITRYFEGTLTAEEKLRLNELIKSDKSFADQFDFEKKTKAAITLEERQKLKAKLREFETESSGRKRRNRKTWIPIAAAILILIGVISIFNSKQTSNSDLFAEYFEPYPNTVAPLVRGENSDDNKTEAFKAYESSDFKSASIFFNRLFENHGAEYARFYEAVSLMADRQFESSKTIFATTVWSEEYSEKVNWYLALNYLHLEQNKNARTILENIVEAKSYQHENAKELLKKMK